MRRNLLTSTRAQQNEESSETGQKQKIKEPSTSKPVNEVGTKELHARHRLKIEDGEIFARARVTDQTFVDKLLLKKVIEIHHHSAAERLVEQAVTAGMFVRTPNWSSIPGNSRKDAYTNGLLRYSRTLKYVEKTLGRDAVEILERVVVMDSGTQDQEELKTVIACLDLLSR